MGISDPGRIQSRPRVSDAEFRFSLRVRALAVRMAAAFNHAPSGDRWQRWDWAAEEALRHDR
jgi:hypothetical protein